MAAVVAGGRLSGGKTAGRRGGAADRITAVRQEDIWDADAAQRYDTPGTGMFAPETLGPAVDCLARLAGDGAALEFAVGTGRVALPLAARGIPVTGIELSAAMIGQLRTKAGEDVLPVIAGDMTAAWRRVSSRWSTWCTTRSPTC
jgi:hypothetical protein